jgi:hypothetical protein
MRDEADTFTGSPNLWLIAVTVMRGTFTRLGPDGVAHPSRP